MTIALIPLDERPVNTRYPRMIAAIAGQTVILPPPDLLPHLRQSADRDGLAAWLESHAASLDTLIVSVETFGYGGLIASRITDEPALAIMQALDVLRQVKVRHPHLKMIAFNVITRIPDANYNFEEPLYWEQHGSALHRYSQLMHRVSAGQPVTDALGTLRASLPAAVVADFTHRRLRNHIVNLSMVEMLDSGVLDLLVISSDDTSEYGFGSQEKAWVSIWRERLQLGDSRLLMYPGADEVGCALMMRALSANEPPVKAYTVYALPEDRDRIAPYEDSPIHVTVERQLKAIGAVPADDLDSADLIIAVNPPSRIGQEYDAELENFALEIERRAAPLAAFVSQIGEWVRAGKRVVLCDVAYPNGSDPDMIAHLLESVDVSRLAAYGAWNTAGNTIGTALAQGAASLKIRTTEQRQAQERFLVHRFIEDWGYQHLLRQQIRDWLESQTGIRDTIPTNESETIERIADGLQALMPRLGTWAQAWRIAGVHLPWHRTFEVDFEVEPAHA